MMLWVSISCGLREPSRLHWGNGRNTGHLLDIAQAESIASVCSIIRQLWIVYQKTEDILWEGNAVVHQWKKYTCTTDQPLEQWALSRAGPTEGTLKGKWCCEGSQPIVYFWVNLALDNSSCFSWSMILNNGKNRTIGPVCVYFVHS